MPELADPVDSDDDPVDVDVDVDVDGVVVVVAIAPDDAADDVVTVPADVEDPAWVCAATTASSATAVVPSTPKPVVSLPRRRSPRSRSAGVRRRFGAAITGSPVAAHASVGLAS